MLEVPLPGVGRGHGDLTIFVVFYLACGAIIQSLLRTSLNIKVWGHGLMEHSARNHEVVGLNPGPGNVVGALSL